MIGIVVPDITTSFFSAVVRRIEELARRSNYQVLLAESQEDTGRERERVQALIARQTDGLIMVPCIDKSPRAGRCAPQRHSDHRVRPGRGRNGFRQHRSGQHRGRTRRDSPPVVARPPQHRHAGVGHGVAEHRRARAGLPRALHEAGLSGQERVVVSGDKADDGERAMRSVFAKPNRPTAVFTSTHILAMGALRAIWSAGLQIPQSISLLTFDESVWMTALRPFLSVIHQPVEEIAQEAWTTMIERLAGRISPPVHLDLRCSLITRESTGRCPPSGTD